MNHKQSHFKILAESKNGYIGVCECCHEFNFTFKTVLITFQLEAMQQFFEWLITNRRAPQHYLPLLQCKRRPGGILGAAIPVVNGVVTGNWIRKTFLTQQHDFFCRCALSYDFCSYPVCC
jgi:hypothetical protein